MARKEPPVVRTHGRGRWYIKLVVVFTSIAVALILAEAGTRVFIHVLKPNVMILDRHLGWTHRANVRRTYVVEGHRALVKTNALGLRGATYAGSSQHARLLILGDSFTDGLEVSNSELFSVLLDEERSDFEVVNAGVGGYGTVQELLVLQRLEPIIVPDVIVLMVYPNDLTDNIMPFYGGIGPRPYIDEDGDMQSITWNSFDPLLLPLPGKRWIHRHSLLGYLARNRFWLPFHQGEWSRYIGQWKASVPDDTKWKLFKALIARVTTGRKLVLVALPTREDVLSGNRQFALQVRAIADASHAEFVDLQQVLRPSHFNTHDIHWNYSGHRAVASYLSRALEYEIAPSS